MKNKVYGGCGRSLVLALLLSGSGVQFTSAHAAATGDSNDISCHGTLKIHPCHINNDRDVNIHFDNVGIHKDDGMRYQQAIAWWLICDDVDPERRLTLAVNGNVISFDRRALATNIRGLGIQIKQNGQPMEINKPLDILYQHPPTLEAVLVKDPSIDELGEGAFSATATLLAEYL